MNILLTGSNGFLGSVIQKSLSNYNLYTLNKTSGNYCVNLCDNIPVFNESYDIVIHSAGLAHFVPHKGIDNDLFIKNNFLATQNLLSGLKSSKLPKNFVLISSVSVYGLNEGTLINENTPLNASDPYGESKILAEDLVKLWCKNNDVNCTILRLPLIVGANPPGNLGDMIKGIQKGYYFNIGGGFSKKSMVLASDVASSLLKAAAIGGIYNLTDGYHPSFSELSECISISLRRGKPMNMPMWLARIIANFGDLLGNKVPFNTNKLKKITSDLTFDDSKARRVFGWNPKQVLDGFEIK